MARNEIEILIKARDEATRQLQAAAAAASGLTGTLASLASAAGPIGAISAALIGVGSAAFVAARGLANEIEALQNLSSQTGVSIQDLQTLQQLLINAGGSAGDATQAINFLNRAIATQDPLLKSLGITTKDTWTAFNQLVQILSNTDDAATRTEIAFQLLGRGSASLLGKIQQIARDLPTARAEFEKLGVVMSDDAVAAATELDKKMDDLNNRLTGLANTAKLAALEFLKALNYWRAPTNTEQIENLEEKSASLRKELARLVAAQTSSNAAVRTAFNFGGGEQAIAKVKAQISELEKALAALRNADAGDASPAVRALSTELAQLALRLTQVKNIDPAISSKLGADLDKVRALLAKGGADAEAQAGKILGSVSRAIEGLGSATKLTATQQAINDLANLFGVSSARARELIAQIQNIEDQSKRLQIRDQLLKVGISFDEEQVNAGLAKIGVKLSQAQFDAIEIGVAPEVEAMDRALAEIAARAEAAEIEAGVRAAPDLASVEDALRSIGVILAASPLPAKIVPTYDLGEFDAALAALGVRLSEEQVRVQVVPDERREPSRDVSTRDGLPAPELLPERSPEEILAAQKRLMDSAISLRDAFQAVGAEWASVVEDMTQNTVIANEAFGAVFNGLQSGFSQVFLNITNSAQTFKSAITTVINSMVQEVLAMLARLAAAKVFQLLIGLVLGGPAGAAAAAAAGGGLSFPTATATLTPQTSQSRAGNDQGALLSAINGLSQQIAEQNGLVLNALAQSGNTYVNQGIDTRSMYEATVAPGGSIRRAQDRLVEIAAVG